MFEEFASTVTNAQFQQKLDRALLDPMGSEASEVVEKVLRFCRLSSSKTPWGEGERAGEITTSFAVQRLQGPATTFFSGAPDDVKDVLALALAHPFENRDSFPATDSGASYDEALRNFRGSTSADRGAGSPLDMSETKLQRQIAENPVAAALSFDNTVNKLLSFIIGGSPNAKSDVPLVNQPMTAVGRNGQSDGVKECNDRGAIHLHTQTRGSLGPRMVADIAHDPELRAASTAALDTMITAEAPLEVHMLDMALKLLKIPRRRDRTFDVPPGGTSAFDAHANSVIGNKNMHEHMKTCTKGTFGKDGCRMCAAWPHDVDETRFVQLKSKSSNYITRHFSHSARRSYGWRPRRRAFTQSRTWLG